MEPIAVEPSLVRVGRDGVLRLSVERHGERTVLAGCHSTLPLQVLCPVALDDPAVIVWILNPTGGLVGGDRLTIDVAVGPGAHACLTTPSATKVYRTAGAVATQAVTLRMAAGATLEWMPDHTIPFAGSAFEQAIDVELGAGARLILADPFAAGRVARGEAWQFQRLESALRIRDARGWLFVDRFRLDGSRPWSGLGATEGHAYFGTFVLVGGREGLAAELERVISGVPDAHAAVGVLARGGIVVRCLARTAPALIGLGGAVWKAARLALLGVPPPDLRKR